MTCLVTSSCGSCLKFFESPRYELCRKSQLFKFYQKSRVGLTTVLIVMNRAIRSFARDYLDFFNFLCYRSICITDNGVSRR